MQRAPSLVRFQAPDSLLTIEVARLLGPFGNVKRCLRGKWSLSDAQLELRYVGMRDGRGREVEPPPFHAGTFHGLRLGHVSDRLLLLLRGDSVLVFDKLRKGVDPELRELRVAPEDE